jgi:hypothetical protein
VQVDPVRRTLKAPGTKRLILRYDGPLSSFGFNFKLRRCIEEMRRDMMAGGGAGRAVGVLEPIVPGGKIVLGGLFTFAAAVIVGESGQRIAGLFAE